MKYTSLKDFLSKEIVLVSACVLAIFSCFFIKPDKQYFEYIDFRTIVLLFSLMIAMAGLRQNGIFYKFGKFLISKTNNVRQLIFVLVMLCFFSSMLITNDVALITFVPFTFAVFNILGEEIRRKWVLFVVCIQTIAANLGSMFTPIGNPQNIYLYEKSGQSFLEFILLMLPYTAFSLALIVLSVILICKKFGNFKLQTINFENKIDENPDSKKIILYVLIFLISLLSVLHILPYQILFCIVIISVLILDHKCFLEVDYSLLFTFIGLFIFIGNISRISAFSDFLGKVLVSREVLISIITSQIISNVPTALLLSGFTENINSLIIGTNLGGLGTLIASMASLISFRQFCGAEPHQKGKYLLVFTISNIMFLIGLIALWLFIK